MQELVNEELNISSNISFLSCSVVASAPLGLSVSAQALAGRTPAQQLARVAGLVSTWHTNSSSSSSVLSCSSRYSIACSVGSQASAPDNNAASIQDSLQLQPGA